MAEPAARHQRLTDEDVRARLTRLEEALALIEQTPGPAGELALAAVTDLAQVYGEALARAVDHVTDHAEAAADSALLDTLVHDELIEHLLVLHEIHPEPLEPRVARAVADLAPAVEERGGRIALRNVEAGVATVELTTSGGGCCGGSGSGDLPAAVREAVLDVAPELADVTVVTKSPPRPPTFVPLAGINIGAAP